MNFTFEIYNNLHYLDLLGTVVFAFTGLLAASRKQLDLFGAIVIAMVTAIGGGTLRDLILDQPVFWIQNPIYVYVVVIATLFLFIYARFKNPPMKSLLFLDAIGLATFTVIGAYKAISLGFPDAIVVIIGVMTGVAGGIIRDALVGEIPLIFRKEIYATASFAGASLLLILINLELGLDLAILLSMLVILLLRLLAIIYNISLPIFKPINPKE